MTSSLSRWQPGISTLLRLVLAGVWLYAGGSKVLDLDASVDSVFAYELLPDGLARFVGAALPFIEIALGVLLLIGFATRAAAIASVVLMAIFVAGIASAAARGLTIDCGCFSEGGALRPGEETSYTKDFVRDGLIAVAATLLAVWPRSLFALDNRTSDAATYSVDDDLVDDEDE
ncbi:MAG: DoxX family membrane protein [Corynebacteriales bacterium]|nr:DoxX family membrane protein [Mycobacteriales bacterium]